VYTHHISFLRVHPLTYAEPTCHNFCVLDLNRYDSLTHGSSDRRLVIYVQNCHLFIASADALRTDTTTPRDLEMLIQLSISHLKLPIWKRMHIDTTLRQSLRARTTVCSRSSPKLIFQTRLSLNCSSSPWARDQFLYDVDTT